MRPFGGFPSRRAGWLVALVVAACAGEETAAVTCRYSDESCIEDARLRGRDVLLLDEKGNPTDQTGTTVEDSTQATVRGDEAFWRLDAGENRIEGRIGYVGRDEGHLAVQLVSEDAINLVLIIPNDGGDERTVEDATLAHGRGHRCDLVASDPPFHVRLVASETSWMAGRYAGRLACPDYTGLEVSGAFRLKEGGVP